MGNETYVELDNRVERQFRLRERAIAALAARQHGVVARHQLLSAGLSRQAISRRVGAGRLHGIHRGVYAVGHRRVSRQGRWLAGVLACGPGASLSWRAGAGLWELRRSEGVEVTVPVQRRAPRGVTVHVATLPADEVTVKDGIPVTTVARTLFDLASCLSRPELEQALREAEVRQLWGPLSLRALLTRYPGRRGTAAWRDVLARADLGLGITRYELERRFARFVAEYTLRRPETNALVEAGRRVCECDAVWRAERVVVELDGHAVHSTRSAFEEDRVRDRLLQLAGWRVVRVTWHQLEEEPRALAADLRRLLAAASAA